MGEYAIYGAGGTEIKIGTCEDMYYLREEHRHRVSHVRGNVDVRSIKELAVLRFRFPWPDEDATAEPGTDNDAHQFDRGLGVTMPDGWKLPEVEHGSIQMQRDYGDGHLLCSIPCPIGPAPLPVQVHQNGWGRGDVIIYQQGYRPAGKDGGLVLAGIAGCAWCGSKFWLPLDRAEEIAVALRAEADRKASGKSYCGWPAEFLQGVADRLLAGYETELHTLSVVPAA